MTPTLLMRAALTVALATALIPGAALAIEGGTASESARWDISLDLPVWPSLGDLQTPALGSFDGLGFGLEVSAHWPVCRVQSSFCGLRACV